MTDEPNDPRDPLIEQLGRYGDALGRRLDEPADGSNVVPLLPASAPRPRRPFLLAAAACVVLIAMTTALVVRARNQGQDIASGTDADAKAIVLKSADTTNNAGSFHYVAKSTYTGKQLTPECAAAVPTSVEASGGVDNRSHIAWDGSSTAANVVAEGAGVDQGSIYVARKTLPSDWPVDKTWVRVSSSDGPGVMSLLVRSPAQQTSMPTFAFGEGFGTSDPRRFLDELKKAAVSIDEVGREPVRGVSTTRFHATMDGAKMIESNAGSSDTAPKSFSAPTITADIWVDDAGLVRRIDDAWEGSEYSTSLELYDYGTDDVAAIPNGADVVAADELPASLFEAYTKGPSISCVGGPPGMSEDERQRMRDEMKSAEECFANEFKQQTDGKTWGQYKAEHPDQFPADGHPNIVIGPNSSSCGRSTAIAVAPTPGTPASPEMQACLNALQGQGLAMPDPTGNHPKECDAVFNGSPAPAPPSVSLCSSGPAAPTPAPGSAPSPMPSPMTSPAPGSAPSPMPCTPGPADPKLKACADAMGKALRDHPPSSEPPSSLPQPSECEGLVTNLPCPPITPDGSPSVCTSQDGVSVGGVPAGPAVSLPVPTTMGG